MKMMWRKQIAIIAILLILLFTYSVTALAVDSTVTYKDSSNEFIFIPSTTDLFQNFKNVMPGDTLSQDIKIKNQSSNKVKVKLYLRAEPVDDKYKDFLSQLSIKIIQDGSTTLFSAKADQQGNLVNNVCLGTFYSGQEANLTVDLTVPLTLGNDYQSDIGVINWVFSAEEFPIDPDDPETGDTSNMIIYIIIALVSIVSLILLWLWRKRLASQ